MSKDSVLFNQWFQFRSANIVTLEQDSDSFNYQECLYLNIHMKENSVSNLLLIIWKYTTVLETSFFSTNRKFPVAIQPLHN